MTSVLDRPTAIRGRNGGVAARRAIVRWALRLFRREWRQQVLVLALLTVAVAATAGGLALVNAAAPRANAVFGNANNILTISGSAQALRADITAARNHFGAVEAITHQKVAIPGSVDNIDLRGQDPHGVYAHSTLRLLAGHYPDGPKQVAVTRRAASTFGLRVGASWRAGGTQRQVVGLVENPRDLLDVFALVAPNDSPPPATISLLVRASRAQVQSFHFPDNAPVLIQSRNLSDQRNAAIVVLALATVGLLFVGLLGVGGFTVLAARRQRALGMLGAIGASDRQIRLVILANGAVVGVVAAAVGTTAGLGLWAVIAPRLEGLVEQRIDPWNLPWWAVGSAAGLAVLTAVAAAWWPARSAARSSIVSALSGRPQRPRPARTFTALGVASLASGVCLLVFSEQHRALMVVCGVVATTVGALLMAPVSLSWLARAATRAPVALRLAFRDLARYQARSAAAAAAITLAVGISATIAVAAAAQGQQDASAVPNLPSTELVVHLTGDQGLPDSEPSAAQLRTAATRARAIAVAVGAPDVIELDQAFNSGSSGATPASGAGTSTVGPGAKGVGHFPVTLARVVPHGFEGSSQMPILFVATPQILAHYGAHASVINSRADVITSRTDVRGLALVSDLGGVIRHPTIQVVASLPQGTSDPSALITATALAKLGVHASPIGWLVPASHSLTGSQINNARNIAAGAGLGIETRRPKADTARVRNYATIAGIALALGVLAMMVGLIRSETAGDLRTLTATGASSRTRRSLTAATAGALSLLGALIGTAAAYLALLAWFHRNVQPLTNVPLADLTALVVGLPLIATITSWLLAGRHPTGLARAAIE